KADLPAVLGAPILHRGGNRRLFRAVVDRDPLGQQRGQLDPRRRLVDGLSPLTAPRSLIVGTGRPGKDQNRRERRCDQRSCDGHPLTRTHARPPCLRECAVLEEVSQDLSALCWDGPKCDRRFPLGVNCRGCSELPGITDNGGVPGKLVAGRYRLGESIGQGGMGRVWRAVDDILDRQVAVKEMRIDGHDAEASRTRRERTLREARATARIDHPNVVRVYDVVDEGERLWIVMELVTGRSLERILAEDGALGPRDAARIGLGLVAALRQVHARGVLHRDIKPGNVLVEALPAERADGRDREHRVVLTDFGIAAIQDAEALTMVGMLVGSPDYMAPERVSGRPQGPPSDVWSLGATLCAALGGRSPFARGTTLATLHAVLYEEPEIPAGAGPLRDVLAALLRKEPGARPGLDQLEASLRASTAPPPLPPPTPTPTVPVPAPGPAPAQDPVPPLDPPGGPPGSSAPQGAGGLRDPAPEPTGGAAPAAVPTARSAPAASPAGSDAAAGPAPPPPLPGPAPVGALPEPAPGPATATSRGGPATSGGDPATARPPGVSLDRARAVTEQRPHPAVGPPPG